MAWRLGRIGIWSSQLRSAEPSRRAEAASELESLGFGTLWFPGGAGGNVLGAAARLLEATDRVAVAPGILNIWMHDPDDVARGRRDLEARHPGRFLLGLGSSHAPLVERSGQRYDRPLTALRVYLDALDAAGDPVPAEARILAALGPRTLELARDRSAGAHPYLTNPVHTAAAREVLGDGPLLAPEQKVVLQTDAAAARAMARQALRIYLELPNYVANLLRSGFTEDDVAAGGSDRLVDGLVAWGTPERIGERVREHHDAGADHVCLQVLPDDPSTLPMEQWRALGHALCRPGQG